MSSLGERIRQARQASGLSIEGLAVKAQMGTQSVWNAEKRGSVPEAYALLRLAMVLGRSIEWLLTGDADARGEKRARRARPGAA